jgi:hypothetical protein
MENTSTHQTLMMMMMMMMTTTTTTVMVIETSVQYVHLKRLTAREDYIKFTRGESAKTYRVLLCYFII